MKYIITLIVWIIPVDLAEPIIGIFTACSGVIIGAFSVPESPKNN
ncbi:MAG: hypothetical protein ACYSW6_11840 [Planctomycetota bacterium]|jgi:hypothetical protein